MFLRTTREMAAELGVTAPALLKWAASDARFPQPIRLNSRSLRWDYAAVLTYVASLRCHCPGPAEAK